MHEGSCQNWVAMQDVLRFAGDKGGEGSAVLLHYIIV